MIFLSINSKRIKKGPCIGGYGYVQWVQYQRKKYVLLYDDCVLGDGLILERGLDLEKDDLLMLRGGAYELIYALYAKASVAKKHNEDCLIGCTQGIGFAASILVDLVGGAGSKLDLMYEFGRFAEERIIEPDAATDRQMLVKAVNRLKKQGVSQKKLLEHLKKDDELYEAGVMIPKTVANLAKLCKP